jgi:hypothetical protein
VAPVPLQLEVVERFKALVEAELEGLGS